MFWEWAAILQVPFIGLVGAWASWALSRHDEASRGNLRRFPSRFRRWLRQRWGNRPHEDERAPKRRRSRYRAPLKSRPTTK